MARRTALDLAFFVRGAADEDAEDTGEGDVLVLTSSETSAYADVSPDRRAAMSRMATLSHLAHQRPWSVLVVPASALVRKLVPRTSLARHGLRVAAEEAIDREALLRGLSDAGYLRAPLVEDPGSFAVRGSLVDVWSTSSETPVRIELYGEPRALDQGVRPVGPEDAQGRAGDGGDLAPAGARGRARRGDDRTREGERPAARGGDRLADDQDARARRRCRERSGLLRRRGVPAGVLRRARPAPCVRARRRRGRPRRSPVDHARAEGGAGAGAGRRGAEGRPDARVPPRDPLLRGGRGGAGAGGAPRRGAPSHGGDRGDRRGDRRLRGGARPGRSRRALARRSDARHQGGAVDARKGRRPRTARPAHRQLAQPRPAGLSRGARADAGRAPHDPAAAPGRGVPHAAGILRSLVARGAGRGDAGRRGAALARRRAPGRRPGARHRGGDLRSARAPPQGEGPHGRRVAGVPRGPPLALARGLRRARRARDRALPGPGPQGRGRTHGGPHRRGVRRRRQAVPAGVAPEPAREVRGRRGRAAEARPPRRQHLLADQGEGRARGPPDGRRAPAHPRGAAGAPGRRLATARRRVRRVRSDLPLRRDERPGARHRRREPRPRDAAPDGPSRLRRRRFRQDRGRPSRGVPRRDGRQAGRRTVSDHGARGAAHAHLRGPHGGLPRHGARALPLPGQEGAGRDAPRNEGGQGRHRGGHPPAPLQGRAPPQPRAARRRRGAAVRGGAQGAHQAAQGEGRRPHAHGHAHSAYLADGGDGDPRPVPHHDAAARSARRADAGDARRRSGDPRGRRPRARPGRPGVLRAQPDRQALREGAAPAAARAAGAHRRLAHGQM